MYTSVIVATAAASLVIALVAFGATAKKFVLFVKKNAKRIETAPTKIKANAEDMIAATDLQVWTPEARAYVKEEQERLYRALAE